MKSIFLLLATACLLLSGCAGYTLGAHKPAHLRKITKLAVPTFENLTLEPRLAVLVTNAVIKQLQNHGSYQIVAKSEAEAVLKGRISNINRTQFRSDLNNVLRSSQIQATLVCPFTIEEKPLARCSTMATPLRTPTSSSKRTCSFLKPSCSKTRRSDSPSTWQIRFPRVGNHCPPHVIRAGFRRRACALRRGRIA